MTSTRLAIVVGALSLVALTGCGSGPSHSATAGGGSVGPSTDPNQAAAPFASQDRQTTTPAGGVAQGSAAHGSAAGSDPGIIASKVIKNGDISITTSDPQQARDQVDALLVRLHGSLDDEQTVYDKDGRIHDSQLVLRVPVASFTGAMRDLEHLGTVVHSSSTGDDVTTQVIDVQQRLRTLRISLHDLNSFQSHAANIDQLLRFENAITVRRGQYQSLKAQRNHLLDQSSMSTINLDISVPPTHAAPVAHTRSVGFGSGLRHGWDAFTDAILVALTALGAVLPFAALLAVIGLPTWWWVRRRGASTTSPARAAE